MDAAMTLYAVVQRARLSLTAAGVESSGADAAELAAFALGVDASELARRMILREEADTGFVERFEGLVEERAARIPLQHLTGRAYFRGLTLAVGPGVFVPRPETESVAQLAIDVARSVGQAPVVVDLCTGSGAIALAIKDELPLASVYAVELGTRSLPLTTWPARSMSW
jgi:release factor glutamine methyltransferase